ncbi:hypothetical protein B0A55_11328, partial [Friedmanniomyces simplex]
MFDTPVGFWHDPALQATQDLAWSTPYPQVPLTYPSEAVLASPALKSSTQHAGGPQGQYFHENFDSHDPVCLPISQESTSGDAMATTRFTVDTPRLTPCLHTVNSGADALSTAQNVTELGRLTAPVSTADEEYVWFADYDTNDLNGVTLPYVHLGGVFGTSASNETTASERSTSPGH